MKRILSTTIAVALACLGSVICCLLGGSQVGGWSLSTPNFNLSVEVGLTGGLVLSLGVALFAKPHGDKWRPSFPRTALLMVPLIVGTSYWLWCVFCGNAAACCQTRILAAGNGAMAQR